MRLPEPVLAASTAAIGVPPVVAAPTIVGRAAADSVGAGLAGAGGAPPAPGSAVPLVGPRPRDRAAFTAGTGLPVSPPFRPGYGDYLRTAGTGEVAAVALAGVGGILVLTGAGGMLGYRQARAGHIVRSGGTRRFLS